MNQVLGIKSIKKRKSMENLDEYGVYCAELVGATYKELGILSSQISLQTLIPGKLIQSDLTIRYVFEHSSGQI